MDYVGKVDLKKVDLVGQEQDDWVRPAEWPHIDPPIPGTQRMQGVYAVFDLPDDEGRTCRILCDGDYTVDWGDGTIENVASGVEAAHTYDYSSAALTSTSYGYKCAVVTVTPQSGQNLTRVNFRRIASGWQTEGDLPWLDLSINGQYLNTLLIGYSGIGGRLRLLERVRIGEHAITDMSAQFFGCSRLQCIEISDTSNVVSFASFLYGCYSLKKLPDLDFSSATNLSYICYYCYSLCDIGDVYAPLCTAADYCFYGCRSIKKIGTLTFAPGCSVNDSVTGCYSLQSILLPTVDQDVNVSNCCMGADALNALFSSLPAVTGKTIIVTGNYGVGQPGYNPYIARDKGWTVIDI